MTTTTTTLPYTLIIGLEVHVQLKTNSKLFSGSRNQFNPQDPNSQTDPVILGLPGALPVMNREAFRLSIKAALGLECQIASYTKWDRKQYFYPDLPKGYQISQYDLPFSSQGKMIVPESEGSAENVTIRINRVHLEEDAGKNMHDESGKGGMSQVDLNRAGTPLLEIVSEPDFRNAYQARRYLEELRLIMLYLGISDCNMQEGSLRCDANVNLHIPTADGGKIATPIVEVKNMNSFRNVEAAIEFESDRQYKEWQETKRTIKDVPKQTRGWNAERGFSYVQREKEEASDYRYFPDPDLLPVTVTEEQKQAIKSEIPELPSIRRKRYVQELKLSQYDADVIIDQGRLYADYFEMATEVCGDGKQAANWLTQDVQRELNNRKISIEVFPIGADVLGHILEKIVKQKLTVKNAREVFAALLEKYDEDKHDPYAEAKGGFTITSIGICTVQMVDDLIKDRSLETVADDGAMDEIIQQVLAKNEKVVNDVRGGKVQAMGPLIGQVVKQLKGANPATVRERILAILGIRNE
jgi:aspartyl-tRNA(Asn)/glutamyl-tRNA(Gln) amidotransferase subunit B